MKRFLFILAGASLLAGCARYDMVLTNGGRISNVSRPKLDRANEVYLYKDVTGSQRLISAGRVVEIAPHSSKNDGPFTAR